MATMSPNMGLTVPTVSTTLGPEWASDINASLSVLDGHNHSPGSGVAITPDGLDISTDLSFIGNNAVDVRSVRFSPNSAPLALGTDLGCIYVANLDLYYNDVSGNQIRITQGGGIAGTPGSISGLTPPASVSYVSGNQTFVFQSGVNIPANLDAGSVILRNVTLNSFGLTLSAPTLSSNYVITLPALPAADSFVTIDNSGNMSTIPQTSVIPVGGIINYPPGSAPTGYLLCNGAAVSRVTYSALFGKVGTTYGAGNGTTTFNVPTSNPYAPVIFNSTGTAIPVYVHSYWHMDATGNEPNVVQPSGFNLTMTGVVNSVPGKFDLARGMFTNSNYLYWPALSSNTTPYDSLPFAIDGWFNTLSGSEAAIMSKTNGSNGWFIRQNASGTITFYADAITVTSPLTYNDGNWHYFAASVLSPSGANNTRLYIDGTLVASGVGTTMPPSTADMIVGFYSGFTSGYQGYLDDISYWNTVPASWATFESIVTARWNSGTGNLLGTAVGIPNNYIIKF